MNKNILLLANFIMLNLGLLLWFNKTNSNIVIEPPKDTIIEKIIEKPKDINYSLKNPLPDFLTYQNTVNQLKTWEEEAPELIKVSTYGKSTSGEDLYYAKISSSAEVKPNVLITGCIHGNEPLSASVVMGYIGNLIDKYGDDSEVTELIKSRDLYFVPVVSPDSYPKYRLVDGVDPNRNFPLKKSDESIKPIKALQDFFLTIKPNAVISGHTFGRAYLIPWGDRIRSTPHDVDYKRIIGKMSEMSNYKMMKANEIYNRPIYGSEVDWYYKNGALAIVAEYGTHQRIPTPQEIKEEFDRTFSAVLHFIKEAPAVNIRYYTLDEWLEAA